MRRYVVHGFLLCGLALPTASAQRAEITEIKVTSIGPKIAPLDSATLFHKATKKCGPAFRCKQGWDIAVLAVTANPIVARGEPTVVRTLVVNLGSVVSPEVPARTSLAGANKRWTVPALGPNDSVEVAVSFVVGDGSGDAIVDLDPDNVTGDKYRDNNTGRAKVQVESRVKLELGEFRSLSSNVKNGEPVRFQYTVRNVSRTFALRGATMTVSWPQSIHLLSSEKSMSFSFPDMGPQEELSAVVVMTNATVLCAATLYCNAGTLNTYAELKPLGSEGGLLATFRDLRVTR